MKGSLLILSGPSGSGKSSLSKKLFEVLDNYYFSISTTTRGTRDKEVEGRDYYFVSREKFEQDIKNDNFFEYAKIHNNYYGTATKPILDAIKEGKLVILDIDVQGREQIVNKISHLCTSVFITTTSCQELQDRLENRGTDTQEVINTRINNAKEEMKCIKDYDYLLINDDLDETFDKLLNIINTISYKVKDEEIGQLIKNW
jgi:guanylate kinase